MKYRLFLTLSFVLFLSFATHGQRADGPAIPLVDYHQHLFSPAKAKVVYDPPLPAVSLPAELADIVRERVRASSDKKALGTLFVEDALMLNTQDEDFPTWLRGRESVADELTRYFAGTYRITPVTFRVDGGTAYIAGYYTRGSGEAE